jgi:hypothetical protein
LGGEDGDHQQEEVGCGRCGIDKEQDLHLYNCGLLPELYSLLEAAGFTELDFLSLDLEGVELQVLKTIPFDKVDIKVSTHQS